MQAADTIFISLIRAEGTPPERIEQSARLLLRELNKDAPGTASFPPPSPAPEGARGDWPEMLQIALQVGTMASTAAVPVIAHFLGRQPAATGVKFSGIDKNGDAYDVTISPGAPARVVLEVAGAIVGGEQA